MNEREIVSNEQNYKTEWQGWCRKIWRAVKAAGEGKPIAFGTHGGWTAVNCGSFIPFLEYFERQDDSNAVMTDRDLSHPDVRELLEYIESCDEILDDAGVPRNGDFRSRLNILVLLYAAEKDIRRITLSCAKCRGSGSVYRSYAGDYMDCPACDGKGM